MGILSRMRKQNAIYWPPALPDDFGRICFGSLVELTFSGGVNARVRWEDTIEEFLDDKGTTRASNATVFVPGLPDGSEIKVGGFLWLGDRANLTSETEPGENESAFEIRRMDKVPNFKATEFLRTAKL